MQQQQQPQSQMKVIIETVAEYYGCKVAVLKDMKVRKTPTTSYRHICWYLLQKLCGLGVYQIAREFDTDHCTVVRALERLKNGSFLSETRLEEALKIQRLVEKGKVTRLNNTGIKLTPIDRYSFDLVEISSHFNACTGRVNACVFDAMYEPVGALRDSRAYREAVADTMARLKELCDLTGLNWTELSKRLPKSPRVERSNEVA